MMARSAADRGLQSFARLLAQARERLGLDIGFVLWDGSTVPAGLAREAFALHIADEGVVARLIRSPKLETLTLLWLSRRIDVRNGTLFDLAHMRKNARTRIADQKTIVAFDVAAIGKQIIGVAGLLEILRPSPRQAASHGPDRQETRGNALGS